MDFKEYLARQELSASGIKKLARSPAYYKWSKENETFDSKALKLGKAVHSAILTPDLFKTEFACAPICDRRTKAGKEIFDAFSMANQGKEILSSEDFLEAVAISNSVLASPKIKNMLSKGEAEKTFFFEIDGVKMKARLDFVSNNAIVDIKTTKNADARIFANDCISLGYDMQFAIYQEAVFQETGDRLPVVLLAVEKDANYDYCVYQMGQDWLDLGMVKVKKLLQVYKDCCEKDEWPGYDKSVQQLVLPSWANMSV